MTESEARHILRDLIAAYPTYPVEADTINLYVNALARVDFEVCAEGAAKWVKAEARFPKISDLLAMTAQRYQPMPALPGPSYKASREENAARFAALRKLIADKSRRPVHPGWKQIGGNAAALADPWCEQVEGYRSSVPAFEAEF